MGNSAAGHYSVGPMSVASYYAGTLEVVRY